MVKSVGLVSPRQLFLKLFQALVLCKIRNSNESGSFFLEGNYAVCMT